MKDDDKSEIPGAEPEQGKEFTGRRKVIKGLASAVPVIMTVTSGEAMATGSFYQCIGKPEPWPDKWKPKNDYMDGWTRALKYYDHINGEDVYKKRLVYSDKWGNIVHPDHNDAKPFTHSCYNSFM